nr:hypothetical protein [Candidatus Enterovibrio luxaltus]
MKHQAIKLTTPDNVTRPFVLNERFQSFHKEKEQLFRNKVIRIIEQFITSIYIVQISTGK